jgi:small subunit ribosomal protein S1
MDDSTDFFDPDKEALSEGWWASVLSEEECVGGSQAESDCQPAQPMSKAEKSDEDIDWGYILNLMENETIISGKVVDSNKGGLLIHGENIQGFVPVSHLDDVIAMEDESLREDSLKEYVNCRLRLKVIECDRQRGRVVLSERAAQTEPGQRQKLLKDLAPGQVVTGRTTNITDFGVFVDLGGVEGLVHISELSWGRVLHPRDYADIGKDITVKVLQVNKEKCRVSLSVKRLEANPWLVVSDKYPPGTVVDGVVTELVKYGAFTRLSDGLEGLIHISEMGLDTGETPDMLLSPGKEVRVEVVQVDSDRQRMSLRLVDPEEG